MLANFSTNPESGVGTNGDDLIIDDVIFIYNKRLSSLMVNGASIPGFNPDVTTYTINTLYCVDNINDVANILNVSATAQSRHATINITQPSSDNNFTATIVVTHDEGTKTYTIQFTNVHQKPSLPNISSTTICAGSLATLTATPAAGSGITYTWYLGNTSITTGNTLSRTSVPAGTYTYNVSVTDSYGCTADGYATGTITANPLPVTPTVSNPDPLCGQSGQVTVTATSSQWGGNNNIVPRWYTMTDDANPVGTTASYSFNLELAEGQSSATATYRVASLNTQTGCRSTLVEVTGLLYPNPAQPTITSTNTAVCGEGTITLTATPAAGTGNSCRWEVDQQITNGLSVPVDVSTSHIPTVNCYTVDAHNCISDPVSVTLVAHELPAAPVIADARCCGTGSLTLTVSQQSNDPALTCYWYNNPNSTATNLGSGNSFSTGTINSTTTYYARYYNSTTGCYSDPTMVRAIIDPVPATPTLTGTAACEGSPATITISNYDASSTYTWSGQVSGEGATVTVSTTDPVSVTVNNGNCSATSTAFAATFYPTPTAPTVSNPRITHCGDASVTLTAETNYQLLWMNEQSVELSGQRLNVTITAGDSALYYAVSVETYQGGVSCRSNGVPVRVVAYEIPAENNTMSITTHEICSGEEYTLMGDQLPEGQTYRWYAGTDLNHPVQTGITYTNTYNVNTTLYYSTYNTQSGCESDKLPVTISVYDAPAQPVITSNTWLCGAGSSMNVTATPGSTGTSVEWFLGQWTEMENGYPLNNITADTTISVRSVRTLAGNHACYSEPLNVTIEVLDVPEATTITPTNVNLCGGGEATFDIVDPSAAYTYTWYRIGTTMEVLGTGPTLSTTFSNSTTIAAAARNGQCEGARGEATVTVSAALAAPIANNVSRCGAGEVTLTATSNLDFVPEYRWYNEGETLVYTGAEYTPNIEETTTFTVKAYNPQTECLSSGATVTATVKAKPQDPVTNTNVQLCTTANYTLNATIEAGMYCQWMNATGATVSSTNTYILRNPVAGSTYNYSVVAISDNGCTSDTVDVTINVHLPMTAGTWVNNYEPTYCNAGEKELIVTPGDNGDYSHWYATATSTEILGVSDAQTPFTYHLQENTTLYHATFDTITGCESARQPITLTIQSLDNIVPTLSNLNPTVCDLNEITISATPDANADGVFFTIISEGENNPSYNEITIQPATVGETIGFTVQNYLLTNDAQGFRCPVGTALQGTVTSLETPQVPVINPQSQNLCGSGDATFSIENPNAEYTYTWYKGNTSEVLGTGSSITRQFTNATTVTAVAQNGNCTSELGSATVNVFEEMAAPIAANVSICGAGEVTLTATSNMDIVPEYRWYNEGETLVYTGPEYTLNIEETKTFTVKAYNPQTQCESEGTTVTATVKSIPETPVVNDITLCEGSTGTLRIENSNETYTYTWNHQGWNAELTGTSISVSESGDYTVTAEFDGCYSVNGTANVTIVPTPAFSNTLQDVAVCEGEEILFELTSNDANIVAHWYKGNEVEPFHTGNSYTFTAEESQTLRYVPVQSSTGCVGNTGYVLVTVNPTPAAPIASNTEYSRCDAGVVTMNAGYGTHATTCLWYDVTGNDLLHNGTIYQPNVTESTQYQLRAYHADNNCYSEPITISVTINEIPATPTVSTEQLCGAGEAEFTAIVDENATTCRWYATNSSNNILYTGLDFTVPVSENTTFYVAAYNENTGCISSTRAEASAVVFDVPTISAFEEITNCGTLESYTLPQPANGQYLYYENENETEPFASTYNYTFSNIETSITYYVSRFDPQTQCESEKTPLQFIIYPTYEPTTLYDTICAGETYTGYGLNFSDTASNVRSYDFPVGQTSIYGCDSVVTLHLTVTPESAVVYQDEICKGEPYSGYGFSLSAAETSADGVLIRENVSTNVWGCDSTTRLELQVRPTYNVSISKMICEGTTFPFGDQQLSQSGTYTHTFESIYGCDSVVTVNLTVSSEHRDTIRATICQGEIYNQYNFNASATGFYTQEHVSSTGCDSIVVLDLTVALPANTDIIDTICQGEIYNQNGFYLEDLTVGEHSRALTLATTNGCDSTVELTLHVLPTYHETYTETICLGESYNDHGFDILPTEAGVSTHTLSLQTITGCDSIITLNLTTLPTYNHTVNVTLCDNSPELPYAFGDRTFSESADYTYTFPSSLGCDSTVTLHLTILPTYTIRIDTAICSSEVPFSFNNQNFYTSTTRTFSHSTTNGCDSIVELHLTVNNDYSIDTTIIVCEGNLPYTFHNVEMTTQGNYTANLTTQTGCDSIYHINLVVTPYDRRYQTVALCSDEFPYILGDSVYNGPGTYTIIQPSSNGCETMTILTLIENQTYHTFDTVTICSNELPYNYNEQLSFVQEGTQEWMSQSVSGCDSLVTVTVQVNPSYLFHDTVGVCQTDVPYIWRGHTLSTSGVTEDHYYTTNNCDSIYRLTLIVNPATDIIETQTICQGDTFYWNSLPLTQPDIYSDSVTNEYGCTNFSRLELIVNPTYHFEETETVCFNELPYDWRGQQLNIAAATQGTFTFHDSLETVNGCDSVYTLTLTVLPSYSFSEQVTVCANALPYEWRGQSLSTNGTYYDSLKTVNDCDSVYILSLDISSFNLTVSEPVELCAGETHTWRGHELSEADTYTDSVMSDNGCYDYYQITITVLPSYNFNDTVVICQTEAPYLWRGRTFSTSCVTEEPYQTTHGCDSVYRLVLTINPATDVTETITLCEGDTAYWNNLPITQSGTYVDSTLNDSGCYDYVRTQFIVNENHHFEDTATVCFNELPYIWRSNKLNITPATQGTFTFHDSLETATGCDSIYTLTLNVLPSYTFSEQNTVCSNELPYLWRGQSLNATGIYADSMQTVDGCDSVYTINLTVNPSNTTISNTVALCEGETHQWRGQVLSEAGTYIDSVENNYGCYDYYQITITINPSYLFSDTVVLCENELPYEWRGYTIYAAGTREVFLQTVNGCDSIFQMTVITHPSYHDIQQLTLCGNETPYLWHGQSITESGTYTDSLQTVDGCDSLFTLHVTVNPSYAMFDTDTLCSQDLPYSWRNRLLTEGGVYTDSLLTTTGCDSLFTLNLIVNPSYLIEENVAICETAVPYEWHGLELSTSGVYYDSLQTTIGCDSIYVLHLSVNEMLTYTLEETICQGMGYNDNGFNLSEEQTMTVGLYTDSLLTTSMVTDCDSIVYLQLTILESPVITIMASATVIDYPQNVVLTASGANSYLWSNGDEGDQIVVYPEDTTTYSVIGTIENGCSATETITIYVTDIDDYTMIEFRLYPNPTTSYINIEGERMQQVELYDLGGKRLAARRTDRDTFTTLHLDHLATGYYLVKIRLDNGQSITRKVLLTR